MGNSFNPYNLDTVARNYDVNNYSDIATTVSGYNVPTHYSTTK